MDKALFYHIADVIQEHRSWIEVIDTHDTVQWNYSLVEISTTSTTR